MILRVFHLLIGSRIRSWSGPIVRCLKDEALTLIIFGGAASVAVSGG